MSTRGAAYNAMMEEETKESLIRMVLDGFDALAAMTEDRDLWRYEHEGDCPVQAKLEVEREANAELLRLLERHHAAWKAEDCILPSHSTLYTGSELYLKTEAAIERAKGQTRKIAGPESAFESTKPPQLSDIKGEPFQDLYTKDADGFWVRNEKPAAQPKEQP